MLIKNTPTHPCHAFFKIPCKRTRKRKKKKRNSRSANDKRTNEIIAKIQIKEYWLHIRVQLLENLNSFEAREGTRNILSASWEGGRDLHPSVGDRDCNRGCVVRYSACVWTGLPTNNITHSGCLCVQRGRLS